MLANAEAVVVPAAGPSQTARPPFEGELAATTLWPETEKIFGHGYEVPYALSAENSMLSRYLVNNFGSLREPNARSHSL